MLQRFQFSEITVRKKRSLTSLDQESSTNLALCRLRLYCIKLHFNVRCSVS